MTGSWAWVDFPGALVVRAREIVSSFALLLLDVLEEVLALPGDRTRGDRSTSERISTMTEVAG